MARYFSKPRNIEEPEWDYEDDPLIPDIQVDEFVAVDTGLIDASGNSIWRAPNEIGYHAEIDE